MARLASSISQTQDQGQQAAGPLTAQQNEDTRGSIKRLTIEPEGGSLSSVNQGFLSSVKKAVTNFFEPIFATIAGATEPQVKRMAFGGSSRGMPISQPPFGEHGLLPPLTADQQATVEPSKENRQKRVKSVRLLLYADLAAFFRSKEYGALTTVEFHNVLRLMKDAVADSPDIDDMQRVLSQAERGIVPEFVPLPLPSSRYKYVSPFQDSKPVTSNLRRPIYRAPATATRQGPTVSQLLAETQSRRDAPLPAAVEKTEERYVDAAVNTFEVPPLQPQPEPIHRPANSFCGRFYYEDDGGESSIFKNNESLGPFREDLTPEIKRRQEIRQAVVNPTHHPFNLRPSALEYIRQLPETLSAPPKPLFVEEPKPLPKPAEFKPVVEFPAVVVDMPPSRFDLGPIESFDDSSPARALAPSIPMAPLLQRIDASPVAIPSVAKPFLASVPPEKSKPAASVSSKQPASSSLLKTIVPQNAPPELGPSAAESKPSAFIHLKDSTDSKPATPVIPPKTEPSSQSTTALGPKAPSLSVTVPAFQEFSKSPLFNLPAVEPSKPSSASNQNSSAGATSFIPEAAGEKQQLFSFGKMSASSPFTLFNAAKPAESKPSSTEAVTNGLLPQQQPEQKQPLFNFGSSSLPPLSFTMTSKKEPVSSDVQLPTETKPLVPAMIRPPLASFAPAAPTQAGNRSMDVDQRSPIYNQPAAPSTNSDQQRPFSFGFTPSSAMPFVQSQPTGSGLGLSTQTATRQQVDFFSSSANLHSPGATALAAMPLFQVQPVGTPREDSTMEGIDDELPPSKLNNFAPQFSGMQPLALSAQTHTLSIPSSNPPTSPHSHPPKPTSSNLLGRKISVPRRLLPPK